MREQESAEARTRAVAKGRAEHQERMSKLRRLRDEQGRQPSLDKGATEQTKGVKLMGAEQSAKYAKYAKLNLFVF